MPNMQGKLDMYTCNCGNKVLTHYLVDGVAPESIFCEKCGGRAVSTLCAVKQIDYEWFRPEYDDLDSMAKSMMDYFQLSYKETLEKLQKWWNQGGLMIKETK